MANVKDIVDELRGEYVEHGFKQVAEIGDALDRLQTGAGDEDALGEIHRQVHSIKGTAYSFGLPEVGVFAAAWERDILDAAPGDVEGRLPGWRGLLRVLGRLFEIARGDAPEPPPHRAAWSHALIWTPFASGRERLETLARARGAAVSVARTDREAIAILSRDDIDTIVTDTASDADLAFDRRASLVGSVAAGMGADWIVDAGADDEADRATALRHGARLPD